MEIFKPSHPNANIHGMIESDGSATCRTSNGKLCTGCCTGLRIEENGILLKEEGSNCPAQRIGQGCAHLINNQPEKRFKVCPKYHCSSDIKKFNEKGGLEERQRLAIEALSCLSHGEIDRGEFLKISERLFNK